MTNGAFKSAGENGDHGVHRDGERSEHTDYHHIRCICLPSYMTYLHIIFV